MLYLTTRNKHDAYTAHRTLLTDTAPDGGLYMPFRMVTLDRRQLLDLADKTFGQCVAETLNRFYSCQLTGWDVDFCIGRYPVKNVDISHRIVIAETWHNQSWDYRSAEQALARKISGSAATEKPSAWLQIAIRIAFLAGIFAELMRQNVTDPERPIDVAVPAGDFSIPMSVWYARYMGLPIANIICGCSDNSAVWDLLHLGTLKIDGNMPQHLEQLVCETLGHNEACRFSELCQKGGVYSLLPVDAEKLRKGMFAAVVSGDRVSSVISNVQRTSNYILGPVSALGYGGMQDYRAKTGESRPVLLLAERSPVCDCGFVADTIGVTEAELKAKLQ